MSYYGEILRGVDAYRRFAEASGQPTSEFPPEGNLCGKCPKRIFPLAGQLAMWLGLRRKPADCTGPQPAENVCPGMVTSMPSAAVLLELGGGITTGPPIDASYICGRDTQPPVHEMPIPQR